MTDQKARAHLRELPRCRYCTKAATHALYTGTNAHMGNFCAAHGKAALARFKAGGDA